MQVAKNSFKKLFYLLIIIKRDLKNRTLAPAWVRRKDVERRDLFGMSSSETAAAFFFFFLTL